MTPEPLTAPDCRLLLSLLAYAIVSPDQRTRVEAWLTHELGVQELVEDVARPLCDAGPAILPADPYLGPAPIKYL